MSDTPMGGYDRSELAGDFEQYIPPEHHVAEDADGSRFVKSESRRITGGLNGVGVLYYPFGMKLDDGTGNLISASALAKEICNLIVFGGCIAIPRQRDYQGNLLWDFKVEGGWPGGDFEGISLDSLRDLRQRVDEAIAAREAAEAAG